MAGIYHLSITQHIMKRMKEGFAPCWPSSLSLCYIRQIPFKVTASLCDSNPAKPASAPSLLNTLHFKSLKFGEHHCDTKAPTSNPEVLSLGRASRRGQKGGRMMLGGGGVFHSL